MYVARSLGLWVLAIGSTHYVFVVVTVPAAVTLSVIRICRIAAHRRGVSAGTAGALGAVWLVCAVLGVQLTPGVPVASRGTAELAVVQVRAAAHNLRDLPDFRAELAAADPYSTLPAADLLTGLRGKDVIVTFVESYGRVAVQGSSFSRDIEAVLDADTDTLRAAGSTRAARS